MMFVFRDATGRGWISSFTKWCLFFLNKGMSSAAQLRRKNLCTSGVYGTKLVDSLQGRQESFFASQDWGDQGLSLVLWLPDLNGW